LCRTRRFLAADKWFVLACPSNSFWFALCEVLGFDHWLNDPDLASNAGRKNRREEIVGRLSEVLATRTAAEWIELFSSRGVPCGPVNSLADAVDDPQTVHNETITELTHPQHGGYKVVQNPLRLSRTPIGARGYAVDLGEQTTDVLLGLGLSADRIEELRKRGVVA